MIDPQAQQLRLALRDVDNLRQLLRATHKELRVLREVAEAASIVVEGYEELSKTMSLKYACEEQSRRFQVMKDALAKLKEIQNDR